MTYQILLNESLDYFMCYVGVRMGLYPFREVVDGHHNEYMHVTHFGIDYWLVFNIDWLIST
jgi:hypothetical protein